MRVASPDVGRQGSRWRSFGHTEQDAGGADNYTLSRSPLRGLAARRLLWAAGRVLCAGAPAPILRDGSLDSHRSLGAARAGFFALGLSLLCSCQTSEQPKSGRVRCFGPNNKDARCYFTCKVKTMDTNQVLRPSFRPWPLESRPLALAFCRSHLHSLTRPLAGSRVVPRAQRHSSAQFIVKAESAPSCSAATSAARSSSLGGQRRGPIAIKWLRRAGPNSRAPRSNRTPGSEPASHLERAIHSTPFSSIRLRFSSRPMSTG